MATQLVSQLGNILNTTLQASTYTKASSFNSALTANALPLDLYAGHDWNSLSTPEQWWARWVSTQSFCKVPFPEDSENGLIALPNTIKSRYISLLTVYVSLYLLMLDIRPVKEAKPTHCKNDFPDL